MPEWITDRLPTAADGDSDGDVTAPADPGRLDGNTRFSHWSIVGPRAPWRHTTYWKAPAQEPAPVAITEAGQPRKVVQITGAPDGLHALCDDGSVWFNSNESGGWYRVPAVPQEAADA
jgi:hypothetical protein